MGRIISRDIRAAGYCVSGVRRKCELLGLDFRAIMRDGFPLEEADKIDDAQIERMAQVARDRIAKEGPET